MTTSSRCDGDARRATVLRFAVRRPAGAVVAAEVEGTTAHRARLAAEQQQPLTLFGAPTFLARGAVAKASLRNDISIVVAVIVFAAKALARSSRDTPGGLRQHQPRCQCARRHPFLRSS
mmetsp:Transcript_9722/g.24956  ORF Transcript_9722/g.24956 Transcript_9722/m.24956 type:complete len:119 (+) Transcript_9722:804-1160(+)